MLKLDEKEGCHYPMRYDAVLHYADVEHSTFCRYRLPDKADPDPTGKVGRVRRSLPRQPVHNNDESNEGNNSQSSNNSISTMDESDK